MKIGWISSNSPLRYINAFVKIYILIFLVLIVSFFGNLSVILMLTGIIITVHVVSKIPWNFTWSVLKFYLIFTFPVLYALSFWVYGDLWSAFSLAMITYVKFFNIMFGSTIFLFTTSSMDILLPLFKIKKLSSLGLTLAGGFSSLLLFDRKIRDIISFQYIRGVKFSFNPLKLGRTFRSLQAIVIPIILQAIDFSENFSLALITKGYASDRSIVLPPYMKFRSIDLLIVTISTILVTFSFIYSYVF